MKEERVFTHMSVANAYESNLFLVVFTYVANVCAENERASESKTTTKWILLCSAIFCCVVLHHIWMYVYKIYPLCRTMFKRVCVFTLMMLLIIITGARTELHANRSWLHTHGISRYLSSPKLCSNQYNDKSGAVNI